MIGENDAIRALASRFDEQRRVAAISAQNWLLDADIASLLDDRSDSIRHRSGIEEGRIRSHRLNASKVRDDIRIIGMKRSFSQDNAAEIAHLPAVLEIAGKHRGIRVHFVIEYG